MTVLLALALALSVAAAGQGGGIAGTISKNDAGISGVTVLVDELGLTTITDQAGHFAIPGVAAGSYTITLTLGSHTLSEPNVRVADATTTFDRSVTWDVGFAETITVTTASRRIERIVDAPGAVAAVSATTLALVGATGQLPQLLAGSVGAEMAQNGLYDYNFNTRGFNGFLTKRIQVIIDGRDPSIPGTFSQEWWTVDAMADDIASVELARGPSAALYGPNSFNGVMNIVTKAPRESEGTQVRITGGTLSTGKLGVRWAGELGRGWYAKVLGGHTRSQDFSRSRTAAGEYPGLPLEVVSRDADGIQLTSGSGRADRYFSDAQYLTAEAGISTGEGQVVMTPGTRGLLNRVTRSFVRAGYTAPQWAVSTAFNRRTGDEVLLGSGAHLVEQGTSVTADGQTHRALLRGRARLVAGVSYSHRLVDSKNARGIQTLYLQSIPTNQGAVFGQFDLDVTNAFKLVAAGRVDSNTLHPTQFSPKIAAVYAIRPNHRVRLGYNRAFQVASHTDLFVNVPAAPPIDVSALEDAFKPFLGGATLGFGSVPIRVIGNPSLDVEKIQAFEAGYSGVIGQRTLVTASYYANRMRDFISGYAPGVNPAYPAYRVPLPLPPPLAGAIEGAANGALAGLTNDPQGLPLIVFSTGNLGRVNSQGAEAELTYFVRDVWRLSGSYAWLDVNPVEGQAVAGVLPNAPRNRVNVGGTYASGPLRLGVDARWQSAFNWSSGVFVGRVPAFAVMDVNARYDLTKHVSLGATVSNALDNRHYEAFGADLIRRLALTYAAISF